MKNTLPLLEFAQENNISIEGLEDKEKTNPIKSDKKNLEEIILDRFTLMSHRLGEISKNKKNNEIIIAYSGSLHTEKEQWNLTDSPKDYLASLKPAEWDFKETVNKKDAEKNYTFKDYLEKIGLKTAAVHLVDIEAISRGNSFTAGHTYNWLDKDNAEKLSKEWKKGWDNYKINHRTPFSIKREGGKNTHFVLNPYEIPENSPALTLFEIIKKNYPDLHKIIQNKKYVDYSPFGYNNMSLVSPVKNGISAKMAEINLKSGKPKKLFLPKQLKNNDSGGEKELQGRSYKKI